MPVSEGYREYVLEQIGRVVPVSGRRMFGGLGLYSDGLFFGLVDDDVLYLKVDDGNRADFERLGLSAFRPFGPDAKPMSYHEAPPDGLEHPDALRPWIESALAAALRARKKK